MSSTEIQRPPTRLYEVRTVHGEAYWAEGDVIESSDGWFTLWADQLTPALRVPEADIRAVRQVDPDELEAQAEERSEPALLEGPACADTPACDGGCCAPRSAEKELKAASEVVKRLTADREEARQWARHGYEIGQRHCGWSDHGVAPDWLTEGWPRSFDSCEHLKRAAELEQAEGIRKRVAKECKAALLEALGMDPTRDWDDIRNAAAGLRKERDTQARVIERVRNLPTEPELMNSEQEHPNVWIHGYKCGVLAAKAATRLRDEETRKP